MERRKARLASGSCSEAFAASPPRLPQLEFNITPRVTMLKNNAAADMEPATAINELVDNALEASGLLCARFVSRSQG